MKDRTVVIWGEWTTMWILSMVHMLTHCLGGRVHQRVEGEGPRDLCLGDQGPPAAGGSLR